MIGRTLGHYRVVAKLGAGGMGEVYRAHDTRLARDVALKLLPEAFAHDPARLARFEREARLLASLNHPNIAAIHGLEEAAGVRFLVLELVEGPTLAELLAEKTQLGRGAPHPLPLEEALALCRQITDALEAAHEKTIIHRDLKPANVKVTPEGTVKVLDFGLAKAFEGEAAAVDSSQSPTLSLAATQAGVMLGTAAYMSPEQARGAKVDKRADIWAFGCVLFELLTGKQPFPATTVPDTLAAVLRAEPDWDPLPADTPATIRRLLRRCLEKDPKRRLHDIADARLEIEDALTAPATPSPATPPIVVPRPAAWRRTLPWSIALVAVIAAVVALWSPWRTSPPAQRDLGRFVVNLPQGESLAGRGSAVAFSRDGTRLAYVARRNGTTGLYLRALDQLEPTPIPGTEGAGSPFFSPDGQWVTFFAERKLKKVPISGGAVLTLCAADVPWGGNWGAKDEIFFASRWGQGLSRVPAAGGTPEVVTKADAKKGETSHRWPEVLPGGEAVLFTAGTGASFDDARIAVLSLKTREWRTLIEGGSNPRYLATGHLVYARAGVLLAVPFDLEQLEVTGAPVPVLEGVTTNATHGDAQFSVSDEGSLVYVPGTAVLSERRLVWVGRNGAERPVTEVRQPYEDLDLSPDGRHIALTIEGVKWNVWVYDVARGSLMRLTFEESNTDPLWTPDGKRLTFTSFRNRQYSLFWKPADGSGPEESLTTSDHFLHAVSWSPDGKVLAYGERHPVTGWDIWVLPLEGERKPQSFLRTPFNEWGPAFSPDGRWLTYESDESGRPEVYVQSYPGPGGKWQISTEGGARPIWAPTGREVFYRNGDKIMAVAIETQPTFSASKPRLLFEGRYWQAGRDYDITPDGQRFVMIKESEQEEAPTQLNVVLNWFDELRRRVP